jgi:hypothetical protein
MVVVVFVAVLVPIVSAVVFAVVVVVVPVAIAVVFAVDVVVVYCICRFIISCCSIYSRSLSRTCCCCSE